MEFLVIAGIIIVFIFIFGQSLAPLLPIFLWFMVFVCASCITFFIITAILAILSHHIVGRFDRLEKTEHFGEHAIYVINGREYQNLFPTDSFLKKWYYQKKDVNLRIFQVGEYFVLFDSISIFIILLGLTSFSVLIYVLLRFLLF